MKVKIGDLTKIRTGKLDANASSEDGQYPFFTCSREPLKISTYSYDCECVLVAGNGDLNVKYYNGKFDAYQRTYIIEDNGSGKLFMPYLYYFMEGYVEELRKQAIGGVIKYIKLGNLTDALIELPSVDEQKAIVDILEKAKNVLDMRNEEISKLDDLIKARFVEMFGDPSTNPKGYPVKVLPEIAEYWNGLTYKPEDVSDEGTIVLRSSNIQNATLDFADTVRVSCKIGDKKYVQDNDILMCSRNGSARLVGKVALIKDIEEPMSFGAFMMIIRSDYYPYLMTYFQMPAFRAQITTGATTTINQITGRMLDIVKLPVPDMDVINEFADFVIQVDKSKFAVQKALDETQILFDSLMQKYFG
ncbi:MAG: restriction endonuclease subunit S [Lachnospiraceae bacterium]|nr:restriction endonuclease subunit S [Lachnospiraceae bacterium]